MRAAALQCCSPYHSPPLGTQNCSVHVLLQQKVVCSPKTDCLNLQGLLIGPNTIHYLVLQSKYH